MLKLFTLRLCDDKDVEKSQVEEWVSKDYFPTDDCLNVCLERKAHLGIAAIMLRKNDGKEAIKNYIFEIEKAIDRERFFDQIALITDQSDGFGKIGQFDHLGLLDTLLEKAARVASTPLRSDVTKPRYGEEAWLIILDGLNRFTNEMLTKIEPFVRTKHVGLSPLEMEKKIEEKRAQMKRFCQRRF
jgi:hypothetical protein